MVFALSPLETRYCGYRFRSRLEARWAIFFDALSIKWEYEYQGFKLADGSCYLPDFWLPRFHYPLGIYAEVKPEGGDYDKAREFVLSGGGALLLCEGTPDQRCYNLLELDHCDESGTAQLIETPVTFHPDYLPGGDHESEYRLYWWPNASCELDFDETLYAVHAARAARFAA